MTISTMLYKLLMGPLELLFDVIYSAATRIVHNPGLAVVFLSLAMNLLVLPLYRRADALQEEDRVQSQRLQPGIRHIKRTFKGDERFMMLQTYYRQNNYKPYYALKGSLSLLLEIPFFIAAYHFLSSLQVLRGVAFGPIRDLGMPDGLLRIAGHTVHLLPVLMTGINIVSGAIYTRGMPPRAKIQLYGMALIFLVFLYDSPSGLVFYWTLNNLFSLVKNVFYRLRNPRLVLGGICSTLGAALLVAFMALGVHLTPIRWTFLLIVVIALQLPLVRHLLRRRLPARADRAPRKGDRRLFVISCVALTLLIGLLIPTAVIRSSPAEFVDIANFHSPLRHVLSALLLAAGAFLVWFNIFYNLASPSGRRTLSFLAAAAALGAAVNYMFFGRDYGNMSAYLQYDDALLVTRPQFLVNTGVVLLIVLLVYLAWRRRPALLRVLYAAASVAMAVMAVTNAAAIQAETRELAATVAAPARDDEADRVHIPLTRDGKNVIVIMMDRAISGFVPYILNERPELRDSFAGFTYYPNAISYGSCTNIGAPALYGGYEYTPEAMNRRADTPLRAKHDEALKVMPVTFLKSGYEVTLCDPTYAGYSWIPNLSVFDDYPEIHRYITQTNAVIADHQGLARHEEMRERNFFCYGVMRSAPVALHSLLYDDARYFESDAFFTQYRKGISRAYGLSSMFLKSYYVLDSLPDYTDVRDGGKDTFLMMSNDATHEPTLLQMPECVPSLAVDNSAYDAAHAVRTTADGGEMRLTTEEQMIHYHANMASMIKLGKWMDFLRENGVYDNSRIIIVSDHGRELDLFGMRMGKRRFTDLLLYNAFLMVKDFDSREFTTDRRFMTNADTPTLAFQGIVSNPVNPFTHQPIDSRQKDAPEHHIAHTSTWDIAMNHGNTFQDLHWIGMKDNFFDRSQWRYIGESLEGED